MAEWMKHSERAFREWERTEPERDAAWQAAVTNEDAAACIRRDEIAADAVREAFYLDTADVNRWETIMSCKMHPRDIARLFVSNLPA